MEKNGVEMVKQFATCVKIFHFLRWKLSAGEFLGDCIVQCDIGRDLQLMTHDLIFNGLLAGVLNFMHFMHCG